MIELKHLRTLAFLEKTGSLAVTAERMHLTPSAISHQLKEIEERLQIALLDRASRPLRLTPAGRQLVALAGRVLPDVEETLARARALARGKAGRLAVASECHACLDWLLPRLRRLRAQFPAIELDIVLSARFDPLPRLIEGAVDVVLSPDRREMAGVVWTELFDYEMKLIAAPDHRFAARPFVTAADLRTETLLVYPIERARLDVFTRFLWPAGVEPERVRPVEDITLMLELAALAQGVAVLPDWAFAAAQKDGRIIACRLGENGLASRLHACVRTAEMHWPHIAAFVAECGKTPVG